MKKLILFITLLVLLINLVQALDCQYTKEIINSTESKFLPYDSNNHQLEEIKIEFSDIWNQPAKIINPNSKDITVVLKLNLNVKSKTWCNPPSQQMNYVRSKELTIPANSFIELPIEKPMANHYCDGFKWNEIIEIQYLNSEDIQVKLTTIENKVLVCDGKDDGALCNSPNECGGGFCIEDHCSNTETCFNNECHCNNNEIQCTNNKQCVQTKIIPLDVKPKCDLDEECISGYIDSETGLCAKSSAQITAEEEQRKKTNLILGIVFASLSLIGMFIYYSFKHKSKKLDIAKIEAEYKKRQYEIEQKNKEIEELKSKSHRTQEESKRLESLSNELNKQITDFEKTSKDFFLKKYAERYGHKIYLDTEKEYIRFKSNNEFWLFCNFRMTSNHKIAVFSA
jgi:hypothetical protein